jgi:hypothetical protein
MPVATFSLPTALHLKLNEIEMSHQWHNTTLLAN